jgi:hypothetical protein
MICITFFFLLRLSSLGSWDWPFLVVFSADFEPLLAPLFAEELLNLIIPFGNTILLTET